MPLGEPQGARLANPPLRALPLASRWILHPGALRPGGLSCSACLLPTQNWVETATVTCAFIGVGFGLFCIVNHCKLCSPELLPSFSILEGLKLLFFVGKPTNQHYPEVGKYLAASDVAGVALLGVQALADREEALRQRVAQLEAEKAQLQQRLTQLEEQYTTLQGQHITLQGQYTTLQERLAAVERLLSGQAHARE